MLVGHAQHSSQLGGILLALRKSHVESRVSSHAKGREGRGPSTQHLWRGAEPPASSSLLLMSGDGGAVLHGDPEWQCKVRRRHGAGITLPQDRSWLVVLAASRCPVACGSVVLLSLGPLEVHSPGRGQEDSSSAFTTCSRMSGQWSAIC